MGNPYISERDYARKQSTATLRKELASRSISRDYRAAARRELNSRNSKNGKTAKMSYWGYNPFE